MDRPDFAQAQWGVKVASLDTGAVLFSRNAEKLLKPASNAKLFTAALALDRLGPDYRIKTSCYASAAPDADGTLHGDLLVYGRGDPSFSARFNTGNYSKALEPLIDAIVKAGIKKIEGAIVGDDSYFSGPQYGAEWTWDDLQNYYGAPASALTCQDNVIDLSFRPGAEVGAPLRIQTLPSTTFIVFSNRTETVSSHAENRIRIYSPPGQNVAYVWGQMTTNAFARPDSIPVGNPALWFVTMLRDALAERGISIAGPPRSVNWLDRQAAPVDLSRLVEVASAESRPISEIVRLTLKPSENLYAQLLLLQVGAHAKPDARNTEAAGLAEERAFLAEAGIDANSVRLDEGSGLSRTCLVTPSAIVQLLTFMAHHRSCAAFTNALPIAGVDGTLRNRFKGTAAAQNIHAKTGSLSGVDTLSGYCTNRAGDHLVFSIMLNNYPETPAAIPGRAAVDDLARAIVESSTP